MKSKSAERRAVLKQVNLTISSFQLTLVFVSIKLPPNFPTFAAWVRKTHATSPRDGAAASKTTNTLTFHKQNSIKTRLLSTKITRSMAGSEL